MGSAALIITAAGKSARMAGGCKKEYREIDGIPILRRVFGFFENLHLFYPIVITCPPGDRSLISEILELPDGISGVLIQEGGETRRDSVFAGLRALETARPDLVLIHDGGRPWITADLIRRVLQGAGEHGACIPVTPPVDTLVSLGDNETIDGYLARERVARVQTPQGFRFPDILKAHRAAALDGKTYNDDSEIYTTYCGRVHTTAGDPSNRKITYPWDLPGGK